MSLPSSSVALLCVFLAVSSPVAAQARVKSPIAGAQQQVPYAPLVIRMERRDATAEVRVERGMGSSLTVLCDFHRGNVSPTGDVRFTCADVAAGWALRVIRRLGSEVTSCATTVVTPAVKAGVPVVLGVIRDQDRPAGLVTYSCRFDP